MKKINCLAFFAKMLLVLLIACNNPTAKTATVLPSKDKLMTEVIAVHDEVMPMISKIEVYQTALREDLKNVDSEEKRAIIFEKLTNLEKADKAMYDWMDNFKTEFPNMTEEQIVAYLQGEKEAVTKMAAIVKSSIAAVEKK